MLHVLRQALLTVWQLLLHLLLQVCIGVLKIYDSLNAKFPAHVLAPKR
jgi:hypothetical protein